jgi:hypothetical protein
LVLFGVCAGFTAEGGDFAAAGLSEALGAFKAAEFTGLPDGERARHLIWILERVGLSVKWEVLQLRLRLSSNSNANLPEKGKLCFYLFCD